MKVSLVFAPLLLLLVQSAIAHPAALEQRGLTTQQRTQRASACRGKISDQAKQIAKQFCTAYLNGQQPARSTTTSVVPATTTATPVTTVQTTSVSTQLDTATTTVTNTVTVPTTITSTAATTTETASVTSTVTSTSTIYTTSTSTQQKRGVSFAQQVASTYPREIIVDACLLYLYGTLAYPVETVTSTSTTTLTASQASTAVSSTATTTTTTATQTDTSLITTMPTVTASATTTQTTTVSFTESTTATTTADGVYQYTYSGYFRTKASIDASSGFEFSHDVPSATIAEARLTHYALPLELYGYGDIKCKSTNGNTCITAGLLRGYSGGEQDIVFNPLASDGKVYVTEGPQYIPAGWDSVYCTRPSTNTGVQLSCRGYNSPSFNTFFSCPNPVAGKDPVIRILPSASTPSGCTPFTLTTT